MKYIVSNQERDGDMIDLHTHSTASDGSCSPERLIDLAAGLGLTAIALTDHDTLSGLDPASRRARETGVRFIRGIEIQIESSGALGEESEFHLLGLGLSGDLGPLAGALEAVRTSRHERNLSMLEKLRQAGFDVTMEELGRFARGEVISRAHFARLLQAKGAVNSIDRAFSLYLGKGRPFYVERQNLALADAVGLIRKAGGIAVIAHPLSLKLGGPALRQFFAHCLDVGVAGVEAYHPNAKLRDCSKLARLGRRLGMLITGGSDFHGENVPQRRLGYTAGGREIPDELLADLPLREHA
jgi:predicted metal-dependent phosphoesterase TrpH